MDTFKAINIVNQYVMETCPHGANVRLYAKNAMLAHCINHRLELKQESMPDKFGDEMWTLDGQAVTFSAINAWQIGWI